MKISCLEENASLFPHFAATCLSLSFVQLCTEKMCFCLVDVNATQMQCFVSITIKVHQARERKKIACAPVLEVGLWQPAEEPSHDITIRVELIVQFILFRLLFQAVRFSDNETFGQILLIWGPSYPHQNCRTL